MKTLMYRNHKELIQLFEQFKADYQSGKIADLNQNQMALRYEVHGQTVGRWINRINKESGEKKKGRQLIQALPADWDWIKLSVPKSIKERFDQLSTDQKIMLYKIFDAEVKLFSGGEGCQIDQFQVEPSNKSIALKISPEAIAIWGALPTIRKSNQFSRASWAINKVIVPFVGIMIK